MAIRNVVTRGYSWTDGIYTIPTRGYLSGDAGYVVPKLPFRVTIFTTVFPARVRF